MKKNLDQSDEEKGFGNKLFNPAKKWEVMSWKNPPEYKGQVNDQPSMTIPDQTLSLKEIQARYARGQSISGSQTVTYGEESLINGINIRTLDLTELQELREKFAQEYAEIQSKMQTELTQKKAKIEEEKFRAKFELEKKNEEFAEKKGKIKKMAEHDLSIEESSL